MATGKILFIQNLWVEQYGIMQLAGFLRARGHDCAVVIGGVREIRRAIASFCPDLLGFSVMTIQHHWVTSTIRELRRCGCTVPIVVGGPHPTFFPEFGAECACDYLCRGDGEEPLAALLSAIAAREKMPAIPNIASRQDGVIVPVPVSYHVSNLSALPPPARDLYAKYQYFRNRPYEIFMASRGCPYACRFCFSHAARQLAASTPPVRRRTVAHVLAEIAAVQRRRPIRQILFLDSTFNLDRDWLLTFCATYQKQIGLPFSCNLRWDLIDDAIAAALAAAGCCSVRAAVESGSERMRIAVLGKGISDAQILAGREILRRYRLPLITFNMLGLPGETIDEAWATIRLNRELAPAAALFDLFLPLPGLDITAEAIARGLLRSERLALLGQSPYRMFESILEQPDIQSIANLQKFATLLVYFPRLEPLVRRLLSLPPNPLFRLICGISYLAMFRRWARCSWSRIAREAIANFTALG